MTERRVRVRVADVADADTLARLLDDFNTEYDTATPGVVVLADRLRRLLPSARMFALLVDEWWPGGPTDPPSAGPAVGCALVSLRPTVWDDGPVATLDELYVVPSRRGSGLGSALLAEVEAQTRRRGGHTVEINVDGDGGGAPRFYQRHGYRNSEQGQDVPLLYYFREL